jgi:hypothetical protein
MITKLLGVVDRVSSVAVAKGGELVSLTDAQLDMVTGGFALVAGSVNNASLDASFSLSDTPGAQLASITGFFTTSGTGSGTLSAQVGPNM